MYLKSDHSNSFGNDNDEQTPDTRDSQTTPHGVTLLSITKLFYVSNTMQVTDRVMFEQRSITRGALTLWDTITVVSVLSLLKKGRKSSKHVFMPIPRM